MTDRRHCHQGHNYPTLAAHLEATYDPLYCGNCGMWAAPDEGVTTCPYCVDWTGGTPLAHRAGATRRCRDCHAPITLAGELLEPLPMEAP